jgi:hypothetical protein
VSRLIARLARDVQAVLAAEPVNLYGTC